jgi:hypothetical protein
MPGKKVHSPQSDYAQKMGTCGETFQRPRQQFMATRGLTHWTEMHVP